MTEIREIFAYIDKDSSGIISKDEARELFEKLENANISESEYDALLAEIDKDNDGTVSFTEFIPLGNFCILTFF
jgi:Ca2+-binding EF-hand superfamily protein